MQISAISELRFFGEFMSNLGFFWYVSSHFATIFGSFRGNGLRIETEQELLPTDDSFHTLAHSQSRSLSLYSVELTNHSNQGFTSNVDVWALSQA